MVKKKTYKRNTRLKIEMYNYPAYKKQLESNAIQNFRYYENLLRLTEAIDEALDIISETQNGDDKLRIIKSHYFERPIQNLTQLSMQNHYSRNTLRNWELEFFNILSEVLGLYDFVG